MSDVLLPPNEVDPALLLAPPVDSAPPTPELPLALLPEQATEDAATKSKLQRLVDRYNM
jgi:hypothetical protein